MDWELYRIFVGKEAITAARAIRSPRPLYRIFVGKEAITFLKKRGGRWLNRT